MLRSTVVLLLLCLTLSVKAQTPTPTPGTGASSKTKTQLGEGCDATGNFVNQRWWLPLNFPGADGNTVQCFFAVSGPVSPLTNVDFQYGFGSSPSSIAADGLTASFPYGVLVSFGSSISGAGSSTSSSTSPTTGSSARGNFGRVPAKARPADSTSTTTGQETTSQAVQQLQNGGDFYLRGIYPLAYGTRGSSAAFLVVDPRIGFNVGGITAQTTLTNTTEYNISVPIEGYATSTSLGDVAQFYGDAKTGYQYVTPDFAAAVNLPVGKNNFLLSSFAGGVEFVGVLRVGFTYVRGPAQFSSVGINEFNKFHLSIQLNPNAAFKKLSK